MSLYQFIFCILLLFFSRIALSSSLSRNSSEPLCSEQQSLVLLRFKDEFSIEKTSPSRCKNSQSKILSWNPGMDCCAWDGVTCNPRTGQVTGIDLSCSRLRGIIHSNSSIFLLHHLQKLDLSFNSFRSSIPSTFGQLSSLTHLRLSSLWLSGHVPAELGYLSDLVSLDLSRNSMLRFDAESFQSVAGNLTKLEHLSLNSVDMFPVTLSSFLNLSSLVSLGLSSVGVQGTLPREIFHLPHLQKLDLSLNFHLTGHFPVSNWSSPLKSLYLSQTNLSGEVQYPISNLKSLEYIDLSSCFFQGPIPASIGNLTQLYYLDLSSNGFTGQVPSSLFTLHQLSSLSLSSNSLEGQIPDMFGNLSRIFKLSLASNHFSGLLPKSGFNLTQLSFMDLSSNRLEGTLDQVMGHRNLQYLILGKNLLTGRIPSWLFTLPSLFYLSIRRNKLSAPADEVQQPSSVLEFVDLGENEISGPTPSFVFDLINIKYLFLDSNNLTALIKSEELSKLKNLESLDLSNNSRLSLESNSNVDFTLPELVSFLSRSCNISQLPTFLTRCASLEEIDLSNNQIGGSISERAFERLNKLSYLNLSSNLLTGLEEQRWEHIEILDLRSNLLEGPLPTPPPSVWIFFISNNKLTGPIPPMFCNLSRLQFLDLSYNRLSGLIPQCLGSGSFNTLLVLDLRMNEFYGSIPGTFGAGNKLTTLGLNGNRLEGSLPRTLANCTELEVLDLGNNNITDTFPDWLGNLPKLQVLILRHNKLYGPIKNSAVTFPFRALRILDLSQNGFNSLLPREYLENFPAIINVENDDDHHKMRYIGSDYYQNSITISMKGSEFTFERILTIFTAIDLSCNQFEGQVPEQVGKLSSLIVLNFSHNYLIGKIPISLADLSSLESLDLSSNRITGEIPWELAGLTFLAVLNLSQNQLVGLIPRGNQFDTFGNESYAGNMGLCGFPLTKKCGDDDAPKLQQEGEEEDCSGMFCWEIVVIGYGCGVGFGLWIGYVVFSTRRPEWFVKMIEGGKKTSRMVRKKKNSRSRRRRN